MYNTALTTLALSSVVDLTPLRKSGGDTQAMGTGRPCCRIISSQRYSWSNRDRQRLGCQAAVGPVGTVAPAGGSVGTVTLRVVKV